MFEFSDQRTAGVSIRIQVASRSNNARKLVFIAGFQTLLIFRNTLEPENNGRNPTGLASAGKEQRQLNDLKIKRMTGQMIYTSYSHTWFRKLFRCVVTLPGLFSLRHYSLAQKFFHPGLSHVKLEV